MFNKRVPLIVMTALFTSAVLAQADAKPDAKGEKRESRLVEEYEKLAGSDANAKSLITGLREGKEVTLTDGKTTTSFTPSTGKMGNGSVDNALLLARESLKEQGIKNPTPEQLKTAVTNVLDQRAQHKGWGEIAKSMGVKMGELKREERQRLARADRREDRAERHGRNEKPEKPEKPERAARGGR